MFSLIRPFIFGLDPEVAHDLAIKSLKLNLIPDNFFKVENEEMLETWLGDLPIRRAGDPDEISGMALYLASEASSYTTGETFNIDGGYMIN